MTSHHFQHQLSYALSLRFPVNRNLLNFHEFSNLSNIDEKKLFSKLLHSNLKGPGSVLKNILSHQQKSFQFWLSVFLSFGGLKHSQCLSHWIWHTGGEIQPSKFAKMRVKLQEHHPTQLVGLSNALDLNQGFIKAVGSLGSLYKTLSRPIVCKEQQETL